METRGSDKQHGSSEVLPGINVSYLNLLKLIISMQKKSAEAKRLIQAEEDCQRELENIELKALCDISSRKRKPTTSSPAP